MKKTNIRKLKQKELKSRKDSRLNKMLLRKRKQKKHKAERKLLKQNKINRSQMNKKGEVSRKRRMRFALICSTIIFLGLATRVGYIQFFEGEKLQQMAYLQQTLNRNINPKRGTIYDSSGKVALATSSSVETITVNPVNIPSNEKEKVATELTQLFNLKYEDVLKKVSKKTAIETIAKKVDKNQTKELRLWMETNNITSGINIDEDTKRFYPYNNLASQIIGFCGSDNQE